MTPGLAALLRRETARPPPPGVAAFAAALARRPGMVAILFYGSNLRSGDLTGVLDFYVLTDGPTRRGLRGWVEARLWPEIAFETLDWEGRVLRAKVATMTLDTFRRAAEGRSLDTTIWTRFVQPCLLPEVESDSARATVLETLAAAAITAARFAAVLGPERGEARAFWGALFRATYAAELRVEAPGREGSVIAADPARYDALLPLAWDAGGVAFSAEDGVLAPAFTDFEGARLRSTWRRRRFWSRPLNLARLAKAALTVPGSLAYAAGKVERHRGVSIRSSAVPAGTANSRR